MILCSNLAFRPSFKGKTKQRRHLEQAERRPNPEGEERSQRKTRRRREGTYSLHSEMMLQMPINLAN